MCLSSVMAVTTRDLVFVRCNNNNAAVVSACGCNTTKQVRSVPVATTLVERQSTLSIMKPYTHHVSYLSCVALCHKQLPTCGVFSVCCCACATAPNVGRHVVNLFTVFVSYCRPASGTRVCAQYDGILGHKANNRGACLGGCWHLHASTHQHCIPEHNNPRSCQCIGCHHNLGGKAHTRTHT